MLLPAKVICKAIRIFMAVSFLIRQMSIPFDDLPSFSLFIRHDCLPSHIQYLSPVRMWHCRHLDVFILGNIYIYISAWISLHKISRTKWILQVSSFPRVTKWPPAALPSALCQELCSTSRAGVMSLQKTANWWAPWGNVMPQGLRKTKTTTKSPKENENIENQNKSSTTLSGMSHHSSSFSI